MRGGTDKSKLMSFIDALGRTALSEGRVYLVGGASALLLGIRDQTIDIDLKLDPEPQGVFESIADPKDRLCVNVELASPDQFLPELPGWRGRSEFIARSGKVDFFHYDFYAQALAKILRGHQTDRTDAIAYVRLGRVDSAQLLKVFASVEPSLIRSPAIDPILVRQKVDSFVEQVRG